ncbi:MAG: cobalamin biosynthesis protein [Chloroflexi bacterium]|nr:cobalamin biosynthesis protein [Chloroflexota bacterium]MDA1228093.1 cobalamin biosynthesis protein [Chloroflexota bacterium]
MNDSPSTAIVAISRRGAEMAYRLAMGLRQEVDLYVERRLADASIPEAIAFDLPVRPLIASLFASRRALVLFMPTGAAVRLLAPYLESKAADPAVVCVDDAGRFAVSLLSGHKGGADDLAHDVARVLEATPVVTSASHVLNTLAVDLLGKQYGWRIESDSDVVTRVSAAVINGEPVALLQDAGEEDWLSDGSLPDNIQACQSMSEFTSSWWSAGLLITDRICLEPVLDALPIVTYRPRTLVVGVGCRRNASVQELDGLLKRTFQRNALAIGSIRCLATIDLKRDEEAISTLAQWLDVPVQYFNGDELNSKPGPSGPSAAYEKLGVVGVSEPAALLVSGNDDLVVRKVKSSSATVAVARMVGAA